VSGIRFDPAQLDDLEQRLMAGIWKSADSETMSQRGVELRRFGPVQATTIGGLRETAWLNLVLGAALPGAVEEGHLAAATEWADSLGIDYYVPVTPGMDGSVAAEEWLRENGYGRGYGWMKFLRDTAPPDFAAPLDVEAVELGEGEGGELGAIVAEGFGLPEWAAALFAGLPGQAGWHCYVARVDGRPAASAAMLVEGGIAEFGLAATRGAARGRGCQTALLRRRILDAAGLGCHTLLVETGERSPDRPEASYRNILRAGFEEAYLRPNWQRPRV
jgi:GNAT superfamily N-acetyltransferase